MLPIIRDGLKIYPTRESGRYTMPGKLFQLLEVRLRSFRNREAAHILAAFLARMNSGPFRLASSFPIDRRALVGHPDLPLSEDRIRGAIKTLESAGYLDRVPDSRGPYERTPATPTAPARVHRRPIRFTFGEDFLAAFRWIAKKCMDRMRSPKGTVGKINYPVNAEFYSEKKEIKPTVPLGEKPRPGASVFARMAALARSLG